MIQYRQLSLFDVMPNAAIPDPPASTLVIYREGFGYKLPNIPKICIDTDPFIGEPWRLWYHYSVANCGNSAKNKNGGIASSDLSLKTGLIWLVTESLLTNT